MGGGVGGFRVLGFRLQRFRVEGFVPQVGTSDTHRVSGRWSFAQAASKLMSVS